MKSLMKEKEVYFDCAATVKPFPEVLKTFEEASLAVYGNTASNHALGYQANALLTKARAQVASYFGVLPEEVIFDSGASEGNNLAIRGVSEHNRGWGKHLITTQGEHPSVLRVFEELERNEGYSVTYLGYDKDGNIDLQDLVNHLDAETSLVSVMAVNNEVGYINPIEKIASLVHSHSKAVFHVDATQAIGKEEIPSSAFDLLSFSGHKIGGLKGSGALIRKKNVILDPQIIGGSQEEGLRAGTTPLGLDCSLATALRLTFASLPERRKNAIALNQALRRGLSAIPEIVINSPLTATPFILNFSLNKHKGSVVAEALSNAGVYVSTKSACSSKEPGVSYVLKAAGLSDVVCRNEIRLSFSGMEDLSVADVFLTTLTQILKNLKEQG
jgi:cysteine desulfurase